ncbi:hypothetical protein [Tessaracoccus antarcticus]|uniref:hypothetical protein n=1 Tax=Tessaracoccus antarcticus TaxID=2479848 RepID=UPI0013141714|nr:hypothetical protein [Tessaracoccus antarcticus]
MSNDSPQGGSPQDPSRNDGAADGHAEDGYPTEAIPQQEYPPQPNPQQGQPGYPQQGNAQQQPQYGQGYPHQGQGYQQQGQGSPPQGQGYPPQGQGYPPQGQGYQQQGQGSPQQGQGGYPPQGWDQQGYAPSYGEPPKKSMAGKVVAIAVIVVVLIFLAGLVWGVMSWRSADAEPQPSVATTVPSDPTPEPSDDVIVDPTEDPTVIPTSQDDEATKPVEPPVSDDPAPAGEPPVMPATVGDFTSVIDTSSDFGTWSSEDYTTFSASWSAYLERDMFRDQMVEPQDIGVWLCGGVEDLEAFSCVTEVHDGTVLVVGAGEVADAVATAAFGDHLLAAWK